METLKKYWNDLPTWAKWAIPIAAAALVFLGIRNQKGAMVSQPPSQFLDSGGMTQEVAAPADSLHMFSDNTKTLIQDNQNLSTGQQTAGGLAEQVGTIAASVNPTLGFGAINYNTATAEEKKQIEAQTKLITTSPDYVQSETARTLGVIEQRKLAGLDTSAQLSYLDNLIGISGKTQLISGKPITIESAPLGVGGINYNTATAEQKKAIETNAQRVATDANYKQSEIDRTKSVIAERAKVGLDTTAQQKYLSTLTK